MTDVAELLAAVPDPELPFLSIADLGILRGWFAYGSEVHVQLTPTYSGCPALDAIRADVERVLRDGGYEPHVETVLSPAWTTDWLTDRGREALAAHGIAPPSGPVLLELSEPHGARGPSASDTSAGVGCPRCGSADTEELSRFGATACKALWRCQECREPFELFKRH